MENLGYFIKSLFIYKGISTKPMHRVSKVLIVTAQILLLVAILVVIAAKSDSFLYDKSMQKQVAQVLGASESVGAGVFCHLQPEIDQKEADQKNLENKSTELSSQVELLDGQIRDTQELIAKQDELIAAANKDIVDKTILAKYKDAIDTGTSQLNDRNTIAALADRNASANKILVVAKPKIEAAKNALTQLETQLAMLGKVYSTMESDAKAVADLEGSLPPLKAEYSALSLKIEDRRKIDTLAAGVKSAESQVNAAKANRRATKAVIDKLVEVYNKTKAEYDKAISVYLAKYNDNSSVSSLVSKLSDITGKISAINTNLPRLKSQFATKYKGVTLDTTKTKLDQFERNYNDQKNKTQIVVDQYNKDIDTYKNTFIPEYNAALSQFNSKYSNPGLTVDQLNTLIKKATDTYNANLDKNKKVQEKITEIQKTKDQYSQNIVDLTAQKSEIKNHRASIVADIENHRKEIENAKSNICPTNETQCSDEVDNDRDGAVDCGDSDCVESSACVITEEKTTEPPVSKESAIIIGVDTSGVSKSTSVKDAQNTANTLDSIETIGTVSTYPSDNQIEVSSSLSEIVINFDKDIYSVNEGELIFVPDNNTGATIRATTIGVDPNNYSVIHAGNFDGEFALNSTYSVYAQLELVVDDKVIAWNKTWSFTVGTPENVSFDDNATDNNSGKRNIYGQVQGVWK